MNNTSIIFLHHFKDTKDWKKFLRKRIVEIEDERHNQVKSMLDRLLDSK